MTTAEVGLATRVDPERNGSVPSGVVATALSTDPLIRLASPRNSAMAGIDGVLVELLGRARLADTTVADDGDEVGHGQRLVLVVGDQQGRGPGLPQHSVDVGTDAGAQSGVE